MKLQGSGRTVWLVLAQSPGGKVAHAIVWGTPAWLTQEDAEAAAGAVKRAGGDARVVTLGELLTPAGLVDAWRKAAAS